MLRQASVQDIKDLRVTKRHGHIVVVTRFYPRFLQRKWIDEYVGALAPSKELLKEFKEAEEHAMDHDKGFEAVEYEAKFELSTEGWAELKRLAEVSSNKAVYLVCHCRLDQYCHRELLLLMAQEKWGAQISRVSHPYNTFHQRLVAMRSMPEPADL